MTPVLAQDNRPFLVVYGPDASPDEGDPDYRQTLTIHLPDEPGLRYVVRLFDPAPGSPNDTTFGTAIGSETRFRLTPGGPAPGGTGDTAASPPAPVADAVFEAGLPGAEGWVDFAEIDAGDGALVDGERVFTLLAEGITGNDGNTFSVDVVPVANAPPARLRSPELTLVVPDRRTILELPFRLPGAAASLKVRNFDLTGGTIAFAGPARRVPLTSSAQGGWHEDEIALEPHEPGKIAAIRLSGGRESPNELSLSVTALDAAGEPLPVPLHLPVRAILPNGRPTAAASIRPLDCRRVELDGDRSSDAESEALTYRWRFENGEERSGRILEHTFADAGRHPVQLEVTDTSGVIGNTDISRFDVVVRDPPVAMLDVSPRVVAVGETVRLAGTGSTAGGEGSGEAGEIVDHEWLVADGTILRGENAQHRFAAPGTYAVRLLVRTNADHPCNASAAFAAVTVNAPPTAIATGDRLVAAGTPANLDGSASADPDGTLTAHTWTVTPEGGTGPVLTLDGPTATATLGTPGRYRVTLTVTDDAGVENSTASTHIPLTVNAPPVADAGPDLAVHAGAPVPFDAAASHDPDGTLAAYRWDFGTGDTATGRTPAFAYHRPGTYTARLTVDDGTGLPNATAHDEVRITVAPPPNVPPTADAGPNRATVAGTPLVFDASGSEDADGNILAYAWDFGDGRTGTGRTVRHAYAAPGTYRVRLVVEDDSGRDNRHGEAGATVTVRPRPNAAPEIELGPDRTVTAGQIVSFAPAAARDPDGAILAWRWRFGDGGRARGPSTRWAFATPGVYEVALAVDDDRGMSATDRLTVTVLPAENAAPVALAGPDVRAAPGEAVPFDATASHDPDGNLVAYLWTFGDGTTSTRPKTHKTYDTPGQYTATLTVEDDSQRPNATAKQSRTITINAPPVALAGPDRHVVPGETVRFDGRASRDEDGTIERFVWTIAGADRTSEPVVLDGAEASHAFETPGLYRVELKVADESGVSGSVTADTALVRVNAPPVARVTHQALAATGELVTFDGTASHDPDGNLVDYRWTFGDGATASGPQTAYTFHVPGTYEVALRVRDDSGLANDVATRRLTITVADPENQTPVADAGPDRTVLVGERIEFDGAGSFDPDHTILSYRWDFGDGRTAGTLSPVHTYWEAGTYEVTLSVTDASGLPSDTGTATVNITVEPRPNLPPVADAGNDMTARVGERLTFDGTRSHDPDGNVVAWHWTYGTGAVAEGPVKVFAFHEPGVYEVRLDVADDSGAPDGRSSDTVAVTVLDAPQGDSASPGPRQAQ